METLVTPEFNLLKKLHEVVKRTPLEKNELLSERYEAEIYLKREDLQNTRSYKIRGAFNKISKLSMEERKKGVVCASAGNHAQGVAFTCRRLGIHAHIFMPRTTPQQKIAQVNFHGREWVNIHLHGNTFDECYQESKLFCEEHQSVFVPPFDDKDIIEGQSSIGIEILEELENPDFLIVPIGGGGLASGIVTALQNKNATTKIIGVEPTGAPSMTAALQAGHPVTLEKVDTFVDGASVKRVGDLNFEICKNQFEEVVLVPEGKICSAILKLYNEEAIVLEPAGALSVSALDAVKEKIKGKKVVCVLSGSNNDITRMEEMKERSLLFEGLKHYFLVNFPQRSGALREFLSHVLGPDDDITWFEYSKKNNREKGPAVIGIEVPLAGQEKRITEAMDKTGFSYEYLNNNQQLFEFLVG
jgi:threonine dehydratase